MAVCYYHVTYEVQSESTLYSLPECQGALCSKQGARSHIMHISSHIIPLQSHNVICLHRLGYTIFWITHETPWIRTPKLGGRSPSKKDFWTYLTDTLFQFPFVFLDSVHAKGLGSVKRKWNYVFWGSLIISLQNILCTNILRVSYWNHSHRKQRDRLKTWTIYLEIIVMLKLNLQPKALGIIL